MHPSVGISSKVRWDWSYQSNFVMWYAEKKTSQWHAYSWWVTSNGGICSWSIEILASSMDMSFYHVITKQLSPWRSSWILHMGSQLEWSYYECSCNSWKHARKLVNWFCQVKLMWTTDKFVSMFLLWKTWERLSFNAKDKKLQINLKKLQTRVVQEEETTDNEQNIISYIWKKQSRSRWEK
jgi:hypothetical protein